MLKGLSTGRRHKTLWVPVALPIGWWRGAELQVHTEAKNRAAPGDFQELAGTAKDSLLGLGTPPHHYVLP